jgi:hypothetical protein
MAGKQVQVRRHILPPTWLRTLVIVVIYAAVMISTNTRFTILDDESTIVACAGNQPSRILQGFISGNPSNEHPPLSEILLHFWLVATNYSFFMLRVFANLFFIAGILITAISSAKIAGKPAYWATLAVGFLWPFAFQYGRITGWYCFSMFLVAWLTWAYLGILDDHDQWSWFSFGFAALFMVWSNYFGVVILLLFLADLAISHRVVARRRLRSVLVVGTVVALSFLPLFNFAFGALRNSAAPIASVIDLKNAFASFSFAVFSIFGSVAVAPWYLPLSIPIFGGTILLLVAIWFSFGRRWLIYFILAIVLLALSGHVSVKRVLFLLPWLFLAIGNSVTSRGSRYSKLSAVAIAVLVFTGWIGIVSGKHYAIANLYEPWDKVAEDAAQDARRGATIVSVNPPFFLYLDYQLGLETDTEVAETAYLGEDLYRSHGYAILQPDDWLTWAGKLHGKVVLVNGSGFLKQVGEQNALNDTLRLHCKVLGEYSTTPDPAALWKARFSKDIPILAYRVDVIWFNCPR